MPKDVELVKRRNLGIFIASERRSIWSRTMSKSDSHSAIPDALKNFDSLPDSANVRQPVVEGLFSCSPATVWRMVKRGTLPAPKKISAGVTAWNVGELRKALA